MEQMIMLMVTGLLGGILVPCLASAWDDYYTDFDDVDGAANSICHRC